MVTTKRKKFLLLVPFILFVFSCIFYTQFHAQEGSAKAQQHAALLFQSYWMAKASLESAPPANNITVLQMILVGTQSTPFLPSFHLNISSEKIESTSPKTAVESSSLEYNLCSGTNKSEGGRMVLSYCVYGKNAFKKYMNDITDVIKESANSTMYRNWDVRVYNEGVFPEQFMQKLKMINRNVHFCDIRQLQQFYLDISKINGRVWRFLPMADPTVDVSCVRDADSPLLTREENAVTEWLQSDKILHVMRDNPMHGVTIMGGLWCFRNSKNRTLGKDLLGLMFTKAERRSAVKEASKQNDQTILHQVLWPRLSTDVMHHDSFLCGHYKGSIPFPTQRKNHFVGCVKPCRYYNLVCPVQCRPPNHTNWTSC